MKRTAILFASLCALLNSQAITRDEILSLMRESAPMPDLVNTDPKLLEAAAEATLQAYQEMPWCGLVPFREFRHFVVPLRVNNEPIDAHRPVIYAELKDRVKGLSMSDAILEVNHWCHEYVTYQPSDGRTHSPLQSMSSCIGRCGEESTFTVAALRAVGIPARQVYTPRWAHTDDNHAWVEAWADGQWHFIGACEPEPVLDRAWFNAPATRGMMMHTFVRGNYDGPEEVVERRDDGVNINVTANYAPVTVTSVTVTDRDGKPVEGADVSFRLYNYAELYPLTTKKSDAKGNASVTTGIGDMIVWASKNGRYGLSQVHAGDSGSSIELRYDDMNLPDGTLTFNLTPPAQGTNIVTPTDEMIAENNARLALEDSLRGVKMKRFIDPDDCDYTAMQLGLSEKDLREVMVGARGNWRPLMVFLQKQSSFKDRRRALAMLKSLSAKDLTDITLAVLEDHMTTPAGEGDDYINYVLCPRVEIEEVVAWRRPITRMLANVGVSSINQLIDWTKSNIEVISDWTPQNVMMHPHRTMIMHKANARSRDLFFVAAARSLGIPARKNPVNGQVQWLDGDVWQTVDFTTRPNEISDIIRQGYVRLVPDSERNSDPAYYRQFTISKIENGVPRLLEYNEEATYSTTFANPIELDSGDYMLVTGQRLADGGVLAKVDFFEVEPGRSVEVPLVIRHDDSEVEVIGSFNSENLFTPVGTDGKEGKASSLLSATGRGYYVLGLIATGQEPSNHTLRDIAEVKEQFEQMGIPMVILFGEGSSPKKYFADKLMPQLPQQTVFGLDKEGKIAEELTKTLNLLQEEKPIFVIADTFNRVVFATQGYTIGLGRALLDTLAKL